MFDLITIGDSLIDTFLLLQGNQANTLINKKQKKLCFDYGEKIAISESHSDVGGNAANVAVGVQKLGLHTAIVSDLGDDINGHVIKKTLKDAGVETKYVELKKGAETRYSVILNYHAERTVLSYHAEREYKLPKIPKTKWIYYTSLGKGFGSLQTELAVYLKENPQTKLAMNPGSYQFSKGLRIIKRIINKAELLVVNKEEAKKIVGRNLPIKALLKKLHAVHAGITVITDGSNGSYATDGEHAWFMPIYPFTPIAKTGAGDAYTSGFLGAIIKGKDIPTAMQWGSANAGKVVQIFGSQKGLCSEYAIKKTVQTYKEIEPRFL